MVKGPHKSRSMTPFSRPAERIRGSIFAGNLVIIAQVHYKLSCGQAEFPKILSQNIHYLEGQGHWPWFSICLMQSYHSISKLWRVIVRTNLWTDRQTYRRTDKSNDNTPSTWKDKRLKRYTHNRKQVASYWCWHNCYPISAIIFHVIFQPLGEVDIIRLYTLCCMYILTLGM